MRAFWIAVAISTLLLAPAGADDKPTPRKLTSAEKKEIAKERKEKLKAREKRARENSKVHTALAEKIRGALEPWEKKQLSGFVLVAQDGKVIFKQGYGFADRQNKRKHTEDTIYETCGITMAFTAVAALKMEMQGKLDLSDRIDKYLKYAPPEHGKITIEQLLTHTSGITAQHRGAEDPDYNDRDAVMKRQFEAPLTHPPGEGFDYCRTNYNVAAAVLEVACGQDFDAYLRKEVFAPLGMKDTDTCALVTKLDLKRSAFGYDNQLRVKEVVTRGLNWSGRGEECVASTPLDLVRFHEALDWSDFLDPTAKDKLSKSGTKYHCLAFQVIPTEKLGSCYFISSGGPGSRAHFARYPDKDTMFLVLLNEYQPGPVIQQEVADDIARALAEAE